MLSVDDSRHEEKSRPRILALNIDSAMLALIREWVDREACDVVHDAPDTSPARGRFDAIIIDVPFPRQGGIDVLARVKDEHPDAPVIVMSSSFFADVNSDGAIARALGAAGVLPKPVTRSALLAAVRRILTPMR